MERPQEKALTIPQSRRRMFGRVSSGLSQNRVYAVCGYSAAAVARGSCAGNAEVSCDRNIWRFIQNSANVGTAEAAVPDECKWLT
jgi:hypothetical protein